MAAEGKRPKRRKAAVSKAERDECVIPPALPHEALPSLLFERDEDEELAIREYIMWQARDEKVTHLEKIATETALGRNLDAWDVYTDTARWWVITSPTNLYRQNLFPSLDYTISFHVGVTARMMSQRDPGVPLPEQALLLGPWRKWEQAAEALDEADEAEEFQAVGMRCRECLIAFVKKFAKSEMVPADREAPKRSDVVGWCELIAHFLAHGASAEHVRNYLKATSKATWHLVSWLTRAETATRMDAELAIDTTQHVLAVFGRAMFRQQHGNPKQCPACGSYMIGLRYLPEGSGLDEPVPGCRRCGWVSDQGEAVAGTVAPA
ncbi:MAG: hypothetical protein ACLQJR_35000 [Stellaceae bacterium]